MNILEKLALIIDTHETDPELIKFSNTGGEDKARFQLACNKHDVKDRHQQGALWQIYLKLIFNFGEA